MPAENLKIISVTGARSKIGKTTLCSLLLKNLKGFGAVKFTKTPLYASLIEDSETLNQTGKDTARFIESGSERVLWVRSPYHELEDIMKIAVSRMTGLKGVIVEGNSPVDFLNPYLIILIVGTEGELKPSAVKVSQKADIIIINSKKKTKEPDFLAMPIKKNAKIFRIDLIKNEGDINDFLGFVKTEINKDQH